MKYLIHADGALPNFALMRLSTYWKGRGEEVRLVRGRGRTLWDGPGAVYGSSIFRFSATKREAIEKEWGPVRWGGTGLDDPEGRRPASNLAEIDPSVPWDDVPPDYSIYPEYRNSIGFSQRGCRLKCAFCDVPKKEGPPRTVAGIAAIWRGEPHPRNIVLLDNDFFGVQQWRERIREIRDGGFRVCFCQGINIRMVTEESARAIAGVEYRDNAFQERRLYTAWDNLGDERTFRRGVEILRAAGVPPKHLMVYMLIGFDQEETWERILERFRKLVELGCKPYPMVYNNARKDLKAFQRWAVTGLYKRLPWEKYRDPRLGNGSGRGLSLAETAGAELPA